VSSGGRITLKLREATPESVLYDAELEATDVARSVVTIRVDDGCVNFAEWEPGSPPGWLVDSARAILRSQWRSETWPRRITRWRAAK
jgi:hypothetical protein